MFETLVASSILISASSRSVLPLPIPPQMFHDFSKTIWSVGPGSTRMRWAVEQSPFVKYGRVYQEVEASMKKESC
jgi:hypothetical protein